LKTLGGWDVLRDTLSSEMFNLWKPLIPAGVEGTWAPIKEQGRMAWYFNTNYPWIGMLFCAPIIGLWYWCTDQYIVQRALGAPNQTEARRGCIFAGALKLLPVFIFIIPGMICFALAKHGQYEALNVLINEDGSVNRLAAQGAFPMLVKTVLPTGVRGVVVAGLMAALMGSLQAPLTPLHALHHGYFPQNSPSGTPTYARLVGRLAVAIMVIIGLLWIEVIRGADGLYNTSNRFRLPGSSDFRVSSSSAFLEAPQCQRLYLSPDCRHCSGLFRMAVDTLLTLGLLENGYAEGSFLWIVNNIYFQYFSVLITLVSVLVMVGVSYATQEPDYVKIKGLTYATSTPEQRRETREGWNWKDVLGTCIVQGMILAAYMYFNG
jgi:SSS family solute:Na+ symporter